eukprot:gene15845-7172_t
MNKAAGPGTTPIEVWKYLGDVGIDILWGLMRKIFSQEEMPCKWRKSSMYKETIVQNHP